MALNLKMTINKEEVLKNKILLIGIGIALVFIWYGYNNIYKEIMSSMRQINMELYKESANTDVSKRLAVLQRELDGYRVHFVKQKDMLWLVERVSKAANDSGLKVVTLNSRPLVPLRYFLYSSVNLAVSGSFHQLGDFVSKIESSEDFMRVEKLSFKKDKEFLNADLIISTYFSK